MPRWGQKIKRAILAGVENHSDLDSDAANATDAKFSEILRSKHNTLGKHLLLCASNPTKQNSQMQCSYIFHMRTYLFPLSTPLSFVFLLASIYMAEMLQSLLHSKGLFTNCGETPALTYTSFLSLIPSSISSTPSFLPFYFWSLLYLIRRYHSFDTGGWRYCTTYITDITWLSEDLIFHVANNTLQDERK